MVEASSKRTVEAEEFILRDSGGKVRARLALVQDEPVLVLCDANGITRAKLAVKGGEPSFELNTANGKVGASISLGGEDAYLALAGGKGKSEAALLVVQGEPNLLLFDNDYKPRATFGLRGGDSYLDLSDSQGKMSAHLETTASGPTVELRDGIPRARIGVDNETASMSLSGKDDPAMLYLSQSSLTISDKQYNGRVSLHLHSDERCGVYLSDASGEQVGSITQGSHGGMILLTNSKGETRAI